MFLNKKQLMVAIPIWISLGAFIYFVPVHNMISLQAHQFDCKTDAEFLQLENGTMIPCKNHPQDNMFATINAKLNHDTVIVYPIFTEYAYSKDGFYEYYKHTCDVSCLNVTIARNGSGYQKLVTDVGSVYSIHPQEETSMTAMILFKKLGYHFITDIDIDKNPKILDRYNKVILLHNEYVTKSEYNEIANKTSVLYLYPNALYAEVKPNYVTNTMILVKGHSYQGITNAFGSGTHSQGEKKLDCSNPFWYKLHNGIEYSCYPEVDLLNNTRLLDVINTWPTNTSFNMTNG